MKDKKKDKQKIALVVLTVLLIIAAGYIVLGEYQRVMSQEQLTAYQLGVQAGYEQAVIQLIQQVSTCQQVPVTLNNQTVNVIAVACLQQATQ